MAHIKKWPEQLNHPYFDANRRLIADESFWLEIIQCAKCQKEFYRRYSKRYSEIEYEDFWEELDEFLEGNHLGINHISDCFKNKMLIISSRSTEKDWQEFYDEYYSTFCHFVICRRCSGLFKNIEERMAQEHPAVEEVLREYETKSAN